MDNETKSILPEHIMRLPRWARVAFAARCARRLLPLAEAWLSGTDQYKSIKRAVEVSEAVSQHRLEPADALAARADAADATNANEASYAGFAAKAACDALYAASDLNRDVEWAASAASSVEAVALAANADRQFRQYLWNDYRHLAQSAQDQKWTDRTPIPPDAFGPMWPDGEPRWWLELLERVRAEKQKVESDEEKKEEQQVRLESVVSDPPAAPPMTLYFDRDAMTPDQVTKFLMELNELYQEMGGDELVITEASAYDFAKVLAPVGGDC